MDSCIYEGQVKHTRSRPAKHAFTYRLFLMYLDLDELDLLKETVDGLITHVEHLKEKQPKK